MDKLEWMSLYPLRMTRERASRVLDSEKQAGTAFLLRQAGSEHGNSHARLTPWRVSEISWQSLGIHTKILTAGCGVTTPAGTVDRE